MMSDLLTYLCPFCNASLNPRENVILRGELKGRRALMLFNPTPGDYSTIIPADFPVEMNDEVAFYCPVCSRDLACPQDPSMAELRFRKEGDEEEQGTVLFSRVAGRRATYFIAEGRVHSFGEHADADGVNYWGVRTTI